MEGVITSAIKQHLLSGAQFAYHQGHSAPDLITALGQTWTKELNYRGEVRVINLDIQAAFDQVRHQEAPAKLESMGIIGQTLCCLESNLISSKVVFVGGGQSSQIQYTSAEDPQVLRLEWCWRVVTAVLTAWIGSPSGDAWNLAPGGSRPGARTLDIGSAQSRDCNLGSGDKAAVVKAKLESLGALASSLLFLEQDSLKPTLYRDLAEALKPPTPEPPHHGYKSRSEAKTLS
eukprot:g43695.t1